MLDVSGNPTTSSPNTPGTLASLFGDGTPGSAGPPGWPPLSDPDQATSDTTSMEYSGKAKGYLGEWDLANVDLIDGIIPSDFDDHTVITENRVKNEEEESQPGYGFDKSAVHNNETASMGFRETSAEQDKDSLFDGSEEHADIQSEAAENTAARNEISSNVKIPDEDETEAGLFVSDNEARVESREQTPEDEPLFMSDGEDNLGLGPGAEHSLLHSPSPSDPDGARYKLRRAPREPGKLILTSIDQDETGNFSPRNRKLPEHIASLNPERRRRPALEPRRSDEQHEARPKSNPTIQHKRRTGECCVVAWRSDSERWCEKLRTMKQDTTTLENGQLRGGDNWPQPSNEPSRNFTLIDENLIRENRLRQRDVNLNQVEEQAPFPELGNPLARGCVACYQLAQVEKKEDDPKYHCSLVSGSRYPCDSCEDMGEYCQLVMEPELKDSCVHCKGKCSFKDDRTQKGDCDDCKANNWECIYGPASGYTRSTPCIGEDPEVVELKRKPRMEQEKKQKKKTEKEAQKQATPTASSSNEGEDEEGSTSPKKKRKTEKEAQKRATPTASSSNECEDEEGSTSPKKKRKTETIIRGLTTAQVREGKKPEPRIGPRPKVRGRHPQLPHRPGYTRFSVPFKQHQHARKDINKWRTGPATIQLQTWPGSGDSDDEDVLPSADAYAAPGDMLSSEAPGASSSPQGRYMMSGALPPPPRVLDAPQTIRTRLYHPVDLNYGRELFCTWRNDKVRMILGFPERPVNVQKTQDGYIELNDQGQPESLQASVRTRLCEECTTNKLFIVTCEPHDLRRIPGAFATTFEDVLSKLVTSENSELSNFNLCSICPQGAIYQCRTLGLKQARAEINDKFCPPGCGLKVCERCFQGLQTHDGDVIELVGEIERGRKDDDMSKIRADAFLFEHVVERLTEPADEPAEEPA